MLELVVPTLEEMWFRESLMADEETMSYNYAWGGTIPFPKENWKGYGSKGLEMLCESAKKNGITVLYDDIAIDNTAIKMFLKQGFFEEYRTEEKIVLKKEL